MASTRACPPLLRAALLLLALGALSPALAGQSGFDDDRVLLPGFWLQQRRA